MIAATFSDALYASTSFTSRQGFLTANDQVLHLVSMLDTTDRLVGLEVPPASPKKKILSGSVIDAWQVPVMQRAQ